MRLLVLLAMVLAGIVPVSAHAARYDKFPLLHYGQHSRYVKDVQWVTAGNKPYHWAKIKAPLRGMKPNGLYGKRTRAAVYSMKYKLGFPHPTGAVVGKDYMQIITGVKKRPIRYVVRAAQRLRLAAPTDSPCALRIARVARSQVGVTEQPIGSNYGFAVRAYQSITGAYRAAWCVSYAQWVQVMARNGTFANRSAGVFYTVAWARDRGYLHAKTKVGALVAFMNYQGHMGTIVKVGAGWFVSIEGNSSNGVRERFHRIGERPEVFIWLPEHYECKRA